MQISFKVYEFAGIKRNHMVLFERYKPHLVGNGSNHQSGVYYSETSSPLVKPWTIRMVLSNGISKSWYLHELDVKNVFLHGNINETIYMH